MVICEEFPGNNCRFYVPFGDGPNRQVWIYSSWGQTQEKRTDSQWDPRRNKTQLVVFYKVSGNWILTQSGPKNARMLVWHVAGNANAFRQSIRTFPRKHSKLSCFDACINYNWQPELVFSLLQLRWPACISHPFSACRMYYPFPYRAIACLFPL